MEIDVNALDIRYKIDTTFDDDVDRYNTHITAEVIDYDDEGEETVVARGSFYNIDVEAVESSDEFGVEDLFDYEDNTLEYYEALYDEEDELDSDMLETIGAEVWNDDLFIVDSLEVLPEYRGNNMGNLLILDAARLFAKKAEVVAVKVQPAQFREREGDSWDEKLGLESLEKDEETATVKVCEYLENIGFKKSGNNEGIMVKFIG